jgi:peptide/nickel transport system substrate-binding protein
VRWVGRSPAHLATITFHLTRPDREFLYKLALPFADAVPADTPLRVMDTTPFMPATGLTLLVVGLQRR